VLLESEELGPYRRDLERSGFACKLDSGAKIFVRPELFQLVTDHLSREATPLKTSHVIVEASLENHVRAAILAARVNHTKRERGTAKVAERTTAQVVLSDLTGIDEHALTQIPTANDLYEQTESPMLHEYVKRTFIHVPVPSSLLSSLSTHAQTV
jgi:hypothetical protein